MSDLTHHEQLLERYFAGLLSESELAEVERLLIDDPQAAQAFAALSREEQRLRAYFRRRRDTARAAEVVQAATIRPAGRSASGRAWSFTAAAMLLLALGAGLYWASTNQLAATMVNEVVAGTISISGAAVAEVPDDIEFDVTSATPAVIRLADGSRAELAPMSRAVLRRNVDSVRQLIVLSRGAGRFQVEKGEREFRVETPVGNVTALGTEFTVEVRPADMRNDLVAATRLPPQLLVAVLTGQVAVDYGNETYALALGDDRIYAATQSMPGAEPDAVGNVVAVSQDDEGATSITLETRKTSSSTERQRTIRLTNDTRLSWVNVPVDRQTPSLGYTATVWRDRSKKETALAVQFAVPKDAGPPPQLTGRVIDVAPDGRTITLELPHLVKNAPRQTRPVVLDADTDVTYFFVPLVAERPTVGYQATVWLFPGSNDSARQVHFSGDKRGHYRPDLMGRIAKVSPDGKELELVTKEKFGSRGGGVTETRRLIRTEADTKVVYQNVANDAQRPAAGLDASIWLREGPPDTAAAIRFAAPAR